MLRGNIASGLHAPAIHAGKNRPARTHPFPTPVGRTTGSTCWGIPEESFSV